MHKALIIKAFDKARENLENKGVSSPSKTEISEELSEFIHKKQDFNLGGRSYRDYHRLAIELDETNEDISIKQLKVVDGLAKYLNYNSYTEFINNKKPRNQLDKKVSFFSKERLIIFILLFIVGIFVYQYFNRQRWMIWNDDHYVEISLDLNKYNLDEIKAYKEDLINDFKKVKVDCNYVFFKENGTVNIWYGKNKNKELEYFTSFGLHPQTGKTLNEITQYMINTHICIK
ncbi:hypothetical protein [Winogradskyella sp. PE311]|uniref:hypothetical protein n=1 Tax=Winogradskyella sp. PE311 TaxID=3366943 RepID=UPI0039808CD7